MLRIRTSYQSDMVRASASSRPQALTTLGLCLLSLITLPISVSLVLLGWLSTYHVKPPIVTGQPKKTILITGVGMAKGLTLARAFHLSGHKVIGADFEDTFTLRLRLIGRYISLSIPIPCSGRSSASLRKFYRLPRPAVDSATAYVDALSSIIRQDNLDIWVSCSGVASAVEDAEAKEYIDANVPSCATIQFGVDATSTLHAKDTFVQFCDSIQWPVPETKVIESVEEVEKFLAGHEDEDVLMTGNEDGGRSRRRVTLANAKYLLKPIGVDDANRPSSSTDSLALLPFLTQAQTQSYLFNLTRSITSNKPWILQQYIQGGREFCTFSLVISGRLRAFTACKSADMLMHYEALPEVSVLNSLCWYAISKLRVARSLYFIRVTHDVSQTDTALTWPLGECALAGDAAAHKGLHRKE
jgi:hypothetical protein